jgi:hypothetical protein
MGESNHNIGKFENSKEGFSVLWETLSIICSDHCFFFLFNFVSFIVYGNVSSYLYGSKCHENWKFHVMCVC